MARIIFLNRFFAPDHSATSQILSDLAFHLAATGADVHVVCGDTLYSDHSKRLPQEDVIQGVKVHRVGGATFGRAGLWGRAVDYIRLYVAFRQRLRVLLQPGDLLIVKTDPPLLSVAVAGLAKKKDAVLVAWLQDLYPEVAGALGFALANGAAGNGLAHLRDRSLASAAAIVAIGDRMKERLIARGVRAEQIHVVPNWSNDGDIVPVARSDNQLRADWRLQDRFVVGYSGNLGRAHEFETLLGAAELLKERKDLAFLFIGGGHHIGQLKGRSASRGLGHLFHFRPYQDRTLLSQALSVPDAHWVSLRPELEGLIVPSKFYGIAAAGRAVVNVGALDGEIAGLVRKHKCGLTFAPGDSEGLASAIQSMMEDIELTDNMGVNARTMLVEQFSKARAVARWEALLAEVSA